MAKPKGGMGGTTRGNGWGDVGFASGFVTPHSWLALFLYNANAFLFEVAPNWVKTHPRWQPRTTLYVLE